MLENKWLMIGLGVAAGFMFANKLAGLPVYNQVVGLAASLKK